MSTDREARSASGEGAAETGSAGTVEGRDADMVRVGWKTVRNTGSAVLVFVPAVMGTSALIQRLGGEDGLDGRPLPSISAALAMLLAADSAYRLQAVMVERRRPDELDRRGAFREVATGALLGTVIAGGVIGTLWRLDCYRADGVRDDATMLLPAAALSAVTASFEEMLVRGILFSNLEDAVGSWWSLAATAAGFGLMHASRPGATAASTAVVAVSGGVVLGSAFLLNRRLWFPIGVHFGWNFVLDGIFGEPVSGRSSDGLVEGRLDGPTFLTGGRFGPEASLLAVVAGAAVGAACLLVAGFRGNLVPPAWRRRER